MFYVVCEKEGRENKGGEIQSHKEEIEKEISRKRSSFTYVFLVGVSLVGAFGCPLRALAEGRLEVNWRVASAVQAAPALRRVTGLLVVVRVRAIVVIIGVHIVIAKGAVESGV